MRLPTPSRRAFTQILGTIVLIGLTFSLSAQPPQKSTANAHPAAPPAHGASKPQNIKQQNQPHLSQWMETHRSLPLNQQQSALEREPGFRDLPSQTQQRMRERLTQLNNMPDEQRRRILDHTEAMEHLTPPQRQQVRGAMQQLGALPVDRRRAVARTFRDLREMPPAQRQATLSSDRFRSQFSDSERGTLTNLLAVEPYLPVQKAADTVDPGK